MDNSELLKRVKKSLSIRDNSSDEDLLYKIEEAKEELLAQGVSQSVIDNNPLAIAAITDWVSQFWKMIPDSSHNDAYLYRVSRLYSISQLEPQPSEFQRLITSDMKLLKTSLGEQLYVKRSAING